MAGLAKLRALERSEISYSETFRGWVLRPRVHFPYPTMNDVTKIWRTRELADFDSLGREGVYVSIVSYYLILRQESQFRNLLKAKSVASHVLQLN
jgi:hypothetical protein